MQFRLLGPLELVADERQVALGGTKQRATLSFLLLHANRVVATSELLRALWSVDDAPASARKILQNAISGLRGVLPGGIGGGGIGGGGNGPGGGRSATALLTQAPGYMMRVDPTEVDLYLFHERVAEGREKLAHGDAASAARLLQDALGLWRGPVLADLVETGIDWPELTAVQHTRLDVMEDYCEAQLASGQHHAVLAELETMVQNEPLRERSCGQLMLALYRCGRQADALNMYSRIRSVLVEDLGLEPGRGLQRLQQAILTQDPELSLVGESGPVRDPRGELPGPGRPREAVRLSAPADAVPPSAADAAHGTAYDSTPADGSPADGRRQVTVLSVRTRLAPELAGRGGQEDLDDLLDGATLVVREQIERYGGTVTASLGSTSLALFGLEGPGHGDAHRAVLAALAVRDVLNVPPGDGLDGAQLTVHAAVSRGEVLLRSRPRDGAPPVVVGAVLDESQALLAHVPAGEVRVCEAVFRETDHAVAYASMDAPSTGRQALGPRERADAAESAEDSEQAHELEALLGLFERTRRRSVPHLVTVLSEPGADRSRFLRALAHRATDGGVRGAAAPAVFLTGRAPTTPHEDPLTAQAQILAAYCGIRPEDGAEAAQHRLAEAVRALFPSRETADRLLRRLMPLAVSTAESCYGVTGEADTLEAWGVLFVEAARRHPVVLCVDDLHRADDFVLDAVEGLAESVGPVPLFVVASAGPELLLRRPAWAGGKSRTTTVTLHRPERLTTEKVVDLLLSTARNERTGHARHGEFSTV
ncbi:BTAD domain-containing putative transcriptional regulator [Streptomyces sp. NPDC047981]|uniref:BTAD domain-containing putative transcriptional regulator n=1 Tax=Streptomyces sp. NPDC047981 TaxID=3154610 RepID=UPI00341D8012